MPLGAEVARDRDRISGAGVGACELGGARPCVEGHDRRLHQLDKGTAFLVPELTDVEVAFDAVDAFDLDIAEHDVARRLGETLAFDDALAVVCVTALAEEPLEYRRFCLLDLEEERIVVVATEQKQEDARVPTLPTPTTFRAACT